MRLQRVDRVDFHITTFEITDDTGYTIKLTPERASKLLDWLLEQQEDIRQLIIGSNNPDTGEQAAL